MGKIKSVASETLLMTLPVGPKAFPNLKSYHKPCFHKAYLKKDLLCLLHIIKSH